MKHKRVFAAFLLIALLGTLTASAQVKKQEVVYARLSPSGDIQGLYIVNDFEADEAAQVEDFGRYAEVENLSSLEELPYGEEQVSFSMPKGRFRYQGNPDWIALPWQISLSYLLDGQPAQPEALSGAEGKLEMTLKVALNPAYKQYAANLALQMTMTLDGDKCLNIQSEKATIAAAGGTYTLAFVVLPGAETAFTITADVQDFSMADLQIAGVRMAMDADMYKQYAEGMLAGSPLQAAAGNMMDSFLNQPQKNPVSFADERNGEISALQFVMMMEAVPAKPMVKEVTQQVQAQDQNVLTRLLNLFTGK